MLFFWDTLFIPLFCKIHGSWKGFLCFIPGRCRHDLGVECQTMNPAIMAAFILGPHCTLLRTLCCGLHHWQINIDILSLGATQHDGCSIKTHNAASEEYSTQSPQDAGLNYRCYHNIFQPAPIIHQTKELLTSSVSASLHSGGAEKGSNWG